MSIQNEISRCDRESAAMLDIVQYDERWLIGWADWENEKRLILGQEVEMPWKGNKDDL